MKELSLSEFKELSIEILLTIHNFCKKNNIKYSLACGTLLGAIRHKGFIPWDDDIDIYMLREDYNEFLRLFPKEFNNVSIASLQTNPKWNRCYAKAFDTRTICIEEAKNDIGIGLGIDVYPIDDVPDDIDEFYRYNKKRKFLQNLYQLKTLKVRKGRGMVKNLVVVLSRIFTCFISFRNLAKIMDKYAQKFNNKGFQHIYETCQGLFGKKHFSKTVFDYTEDVSFEGYKLKGMSGYDEYLSSFYGNYMQLPPEEKRIAHHSFKVYWK